MWLIRVCVLLVAIASANATVFRKCCPNEEILLKLVTTNETSYSCVNMENLETNYNTSATPLFLGPNVTVEDGLPKDCDAFREMQQVDFYIQLDGPINKCYDRVLPIEYASNKVKHNIPETMQIACKSISETEQMNNNTILNINKIRKCCPKGQSYDVEFHLCRKVEFESTADWLLQTFNINNDDYIYEVTTGLHCKSDEYGVELQDTHFIFEVEESTLNIYSKNGDNKRSAAKGEWCLDRDFHGAGLVARVCTRDCSKYDAFCFRKCCPAGQHYRVRSCGKLISSCVPSNGQVFFDASEYLSPLKAINSKIDDVVGLREDLFCPRGRYALNKSAVLDKHMMTEEGYLVQWTEDGVEVVQRDYCLEIFDSSHCPGGDMSINGVMCFVAQHPDKNFKLSFVAIVLSAVCLALTLMVYCSLPDLWNLNGLNLICHAATMLFAYSCLARVQINVVPNKTICTLLGYGIYFGFVAAFMWLNVMCFDIWWTFGNIRTVQTMRKNGSTWRRFFWYSLYAWSLSILLTLTMFLLDKYPLSDYLDSNIGNDICWFQAVQNTRSDWPHYIFFVIPMGVIVLINFIFWVLTARHCAKVKSEVHRMQAGSVGDRAKRIFRVDRAKYVLTGKLWVVMGAGWLAEIVSTVAPEPVWLWQFVDLLNELQGVFIFLILVVKPKVYRLIRKRLGLEKPGEQKNGRSSATVSTYLSRTISSDERALKSVSTNTKGA